jgi:hypothetical protein
MIPYPNVPHIPDVSLWADGGVFDQLAAERASQDGKWGEQNHPDGTSLTLESTADVYRRDADRAAKLGTITWAHILREEMAEAMAETDAAKLRAELIQVAAVAVNWIEAIDRRAAQ